MKDSIKDSNSSKNDSIDESSNTKKGQTGSNKVKYQRLSTENSFNKKPKSEKCTTKKKCLILSLIITALTLFIMSILYCISYSQKKITNYQRINIPTYYPTNTLAKEMFYTNIGFSTGGAKDTNNFRENIKNGYFPISTDITYNGLFYDYYFDTGRQTESKYLFSPSYSCAISKDPISLKNEYYITVGLNSNIKENDFQRKKLNLIVLLDISGSMYSGFDSYHYDQFSLGKQNLSKSDDERKSKMVIANEAVNILIDQLNDDDRLGIVLFNQNANVLKKIELVSEMDIEKTKKKSFRNWCKWRNKFRIRIHKSYSIIRKIQKFKKNRI